jgi:hypothetical protein
VPAFRSDASAVEAARTAEKLGFDGVFSFDHLWPIGQPQRPALSAMPLLGAVAAATKNVRVGTLVARIGLLSDELLVESLLSLDRISSGRLIAGIGVGDTMSAIENIAYGIPLDSPEERLASLGWCASTLSQKGVTVWIGGGMSETSPTSGLAQNLGLIVNVWNVSATGVAELSRRHTAEVTWGGDPGTSVAGATEKLKGIAEAGASWAVCTWPGSPGSTSSIEELAQAADQVRRA